MTKKYKNQENSIQWDIVAVWVGAICFGILFWVVILKFAGVL